ncbi:hypothetical protein K469DRAFT_756347 [Zopfia rhizophila CBS 207.26]|uniref:Uncharacterized protein n=1 Tax=Zopfia rhizophila CBS 207.26 TaxID=1314779 RepID=A0A6A6D855_9PEZI|nr:hypothetical protein K469DRAFT_756347 [Zopfia rhizophila CBS 207.26]
MTERARLNLEEDDALDLLETLDWKVRDNRSLFDDASKSLVHSVVNKEPQPPGPDVKGIGYANLVDSYFEMPNQETHDHASNAKVWGEDDAANEGEELVEGCRLYDVGWMKARIENLIPEKHARLIRSGGWHSYYRRPPKVWTW